MTTARPPPPIIFSFLLPHLCPISLAPLRNPLHRLLRWARLAADSRPVEWGNPTKALILRRRIRPLPSPPDITRFTTKRSIRHTRL